MPVAQKVGPDGCMYILDWYDRYHCYQDANRDPAGIDRLRGRLYRVVYKDYKAAGTFDMAQKKHVELLDALLQPNVYLRETAQRLLTERTPNRDNLKALLLEENLIGEVLLQEIAFDDTGKWTDKNNLRALWVRIARDDLSSKLQMRLLQHKNPAFRAQGIRAVCNMGIDKGRTELNMDFGNGKANLQLGHGSQLDPAVRKKLLELSKDPSPDVQLQVAIAARKLKGVDPLPVLLDVLSHCGDDKLIPHIVWQNLHPLLEKDGERFLTLASKVDLAKAPGVAKVLPRAIDRILGNPSGDPAAVVKFIDKLADKEPTPTTWLCLSALAVKVQNGEIAGPALEKLKKGITPVLPKFYDHPSTRTEAIFLSVTLGEPRFAEYCTGLVHGGATENLRLLAMNALMTGNPIALKEGVSKALLATDAEMPAFRGQLLGRLGKLNDAWVADAVLTGYPTFNDDEKAKGIELLTQRPAWAKSLFKKIAAKKISKDAINVNQARRLLGTKDAELTKLIEKHWGIPRDSRNPEREKIAAQMKDLFKKTPGDAKAGVVVFKKLCAQCHKIYGDGVDVGPDITSNGRADFDQLLSNIFDPSLVIGAGYQAVTVTTKQGQSLTGLIVEDNPQRVVLKVQGGEVKTIARADVDEQITSKVSLMPEDLEKQLRPQEIVDLLAYLSLDRPPDDAKAKRIPGTPR